MPIAFFNCSTLIDDMLVAGLAVIVEGAHIVAIVPEGDIPAFAERRDLDGAVLAPGFIDTQVNGGGGVLFNDAPTVETIATIGAAHRRYGTTGFLPTLISDDLATVREGVRAVDAAIEAGVPGVLGIHIEGPFLNIDRKGIHDPGKIIVLDEAGFASVTGLTRGRTLVTLAPEKTLPETIARLVAAGVIVAAGHTDGSYDDIRAALDHGLTGFTHLFNAMSPLTSREPGAVGAALDDAGSWCGLIVDGRHVHPATMRVALRAKQDRIMLVTDAMPSVGQADKSFILQGHRVEVIDGVCVNDDGTLAGSDLDMAQAVRNTRDMIGTTLAEALVMASRNPADFLGLAASHGRIGVGARADLVVLSEDGLPLATWIGGR
ncbi:N-acetylglucosamine-6-phosphate deacetylase [Sphingomonas alpina]|uniref:N-acetylglucosamine-6-phosphate deacetylase n=1 Tax=Sphingomonas alpina TaxID=653931 RepID=A0A7H0LGR7_9SPHN|nr:N-acetylglucosamine-6-phosphate deacetylase [Sphingomonas alpina]QNQ08870.1 N-acetylglucosamine-6-phosphate deacetylase [Sphingomonas alpina]